MRTNHLLGLSLGLMLIPISVFGQSIENAWHSFSQGKFTCADDPVHIDIDKAVSHHHPDYRSWVADHFPGWIPNPPPNSAYLEQEKTGDFTFNNFDFIIGKEKFSVYSKKNPAGWDGSRDYIKKYGLIKGWHLRMKGRYYVRPVYPFLYNSKLVSLVGVVGDTKTIIEIRDSNSGRVIHEIDLPKEVRQSNYNSLRYETWPYISNGFLFVCTNPKEVDPRPRPIWEKDQKDQFVPGALPKFLVYDLRLWFSSK